MNPLHKSGIFFFVLMLAGALISVAQNPSKNALPREIKGQIDSIFLEFDHLKTPGYAIGIMKNGKTLYQKGYGAANLDYGIPITPKTVFSIASVSKRFTGACLALLILDGKLSLETPASDFIPELAKYPDTIRIKHLIYNTSGLKDYFFYDRPGDKSWITFNYFDVDECLDFALSRDTLLFPPGTKWQYSNVNFMLIAKIVEKVSGMTFHEFAKSRLFQPLGMSASGINDDITQIIPNRATPYNIRNQDNVQGYRDAGVFVREDGQFIRHPRISPHYGGSGVMTSIEDLMKWCRNMHTKTFGGEELYDQIHQTGTFPHGRNNQAFGIYIGDFNGKKIVAWDGGDWGISAEMWRFPDQGLAIVVLSNLGSGFSAGKVTQIAEILEREGVFNE